MRLRLLAVLVCLLFVGKADATFVHPGVQGWGLGGGAEIPRAVTGLLGWWDVSDPNSRTVSGGDITQLTDKSGGGYHFVSGTSPSLRLADQSGLDVAEFVAASSEHLLAGGIGAVLSGTDTPFTLIYVGKNDSGDALAGHFGLGRVSTSTPFMKIGQTTSAAGKHHTQRRDDANNLVEDLPTSPSPVSTDYEVYAFTFHGTTLDLTVGTTVVRAGAALDVGDATFDRFGMGGRIRSTIDEFWDGKMGEAILYNRALAANELTKIKNYLAMKWDLSV